MLDMQREDSQRGKSRLPWQTDLSGAERKKEQVSRGRKLEEHLGWRGVGLQAERGWQLLYTQQEHLDRGCPIRWRYGDREVAVQAERNPFHKFLGDAEWQSLLPAFTSQEYVQERISGDLFFSMFISSMFYTTGGSFQKDTALLSVSPIEDQVKTSCQQLGNGILQG